MNLQTLIGLYTGDNGLTHGVLTVLLVMTVVQVAPIKIDPWKFIFERIGGWLNSSIIARVESIERKLDNHIVEYEHDKIADMRMKILDFANACMNNRPQTQEAYIYMLKLCDGYEEYIQSNGQRNGEVALAMDEIKRLYSRNMQENSFLKEGQ